MPDGGAGFFEYTPDLFHVGVNGRSGHVVTDQPDRPAAVGWLAASIAICSKAMLQPIDHGDYYHFSNAMPS